MFVRISAVFVLKRHAIGFSELPVRLSTIQAGNHSAPAAADQAATPRPALPRPARLRPATVSRPPTSVHPPVEGLDRSAAEALAALVTSVADAVYAVDATGRVSYANPAALSILGYAGAETELLRQPSHQTIHHTRPDGTSFPEQECPLLRPRQTGDPVRVDDDWFVRRDGSLIPVAYSSAPYETADGRGAVVVFRDTTELRAAQAEQQRLAVERAQAQARAEELHASRARILAAAHEERRRLGRDLHDGAQQHLVNVVVTLELALGSQAQDAASPDPSLQQALQEARAGLHDLRELAAGLLPSVLVHRGLRGAIETLTARAPLPVSLTLPDQRFDPTIESTAYFLVAEALTNVAKHAEATSAAVRIYATADQLQIEIQDDGHGGADPLKGSGLRGIEDRLQALDGTLELTSTASGTVVHVQVPLSSPPAT
jgi:PAS domain S-box-containing protein